jgi:hypothetical protein
MFVGAAVLTGCALLSSIWGTVVTSQTGDEPAKAPSSTAAPGTAQGVIDSAARVLAPGEISGEGVYGVGSDLQPGTYRTAGPTPAAFDNCYWERSRDTSGQQKSVIANGIVTGPVTVTIKRTDRAFKTSGCENWARVQ